MKKIALFCLVLALTLSLNSGMLISAGIAHASSPVKVQIKATYTPAQTMDLIKNNKDLVIVDVRSEEELVEGKIQGSILVPFVEFMRGAHNLPKDRTILLVCAVGGRSYVAMQVLSHQGYNDLYNLKGGISAWDDANLPLIY